MAKVNLPYIFTPKAKGKLYYYYRRDGQRIPITSINGRKLVPADPGFMDAWQRIHDSFEASGKATDARIGTLGHVIEEYLASPEFAQRSAGTKRDYRRYCDFLKENYGKFSVRSMPREFVIKLRDKHSDKPRTANYIIQVLRLLLTFAHDRSNTFLLPPGWSNPASRPKKLQTGEGYRPWEEHEIAAFRNTWPIGTIERTLFELLSNSGQRGGDVIAMTRHSLLSDGTIKVVQEKTGGRVDVPISKALKAALDPYLASHTNLALVVSEKGKRFKVDRFRHVMRAAYDKAELPKDCATHGLRYTAATVLCELGCDWQMIASITGHETSEMVRKYTGKKRKAMAAIAMLDSIENV